MVVGSNERLRFTSSCELEFFLEGTEKSAQKLDALKFAARNTHSHSEVAKTMDIALAAG
jgi:hypothetical protein